MGVYIRAKFEVSSMILTSFRQGVILSPPPQNEPLKSPPRLGLKDNFPYGVASEKMPSGSQINANFLIILVLVIWVFSNENDFPISSFFFSQMTPRIFASLVSP